MTILDKDYLIKYNIKSIRTITESSFDPTVIITFNDDKTFSFILHDVLDKYNTIDYHVKEQYVLNRNKKIGKITKIIWKNQKQYLSL